MTSLELQVSKALTEAYNFAEKQGLLQSFLNFFKKKHRVLVLGSSGVGKTQLIRSLTDVVPELVSVIERTKFPKISKLSVNQHLFEFLDTPGELNKTEIREKVLKEAVDRKFPLIINVVSYGFHEYSASGERRFFENGKLSADYLDEHKLIENDLFAQWVTSLSNLKVRARVLTVASKADIWWKDRDQVLEHYGSGAYSEALIGSDLEHAVLPYCSRIKRFHEVGEVCSTFDETIKGELRKGFFEAFVAACGISESLH